MAVCDDLHRIAYTPLETGLYWRVLHTAFGALQPHPTSIGRLALVQDQPPGTMPLSTFYFAWHPAGALWETGLRGIPGDAQQVELDPGWLASHKLACIELQRELPIIALDHPARRKVIDYESPEDQRWHGHLTTTRYARTHRAAAAVYRQCQQANQPFPGFRWPSRQVQSELVGVLYGPAFNPDDWKVVDVHDLSSGLGFAHLENALAIGGFQRVASLGRVGGTPIGGR